VPYRALHPSALWCRDARAVRSVPTELGAGMSPGLEVVPLDRRIGEYASVAIGRQAGRASLMAAISTIALLLIVTPFVVFGLNEESDAPVPVLLVLLIVLIPALLVAMGIAYLYRSMYRGGKGIGFVKWAARVSTPLGFLLFYGPFLVVRLIPADPLIGIYAIALGLNVSFGLWFLRWTKSYAIKWQDAYRDAIANDQFLLPGAGDGLAFTLREAIGIPPGWLIDRWKVARILILVVASILIEGFAVSFVIDSVISLRVSQGDLGDLLGRTIESRTDIVLFSIVAVFSPLLAFPGLALAGWLRRRARRASIHSLREVRAKDRRSPILFLRPFHDDQVAVTRRHDRSLFERILCRSSLFSNVDELLTEKYWHVGPVIAVGKPGGALPPFGAARAYLTGASWQSAVASLMHEARVIVIVLDYSEGVTWELRQALQYGHLAKTLLLIPPHRHGDQNLVRHVLTILGKRPDALVVESEPLIAIFPTPSARLIACCASQVDSYAYDFVLRMGFHSLIGKNTQMLRMLSVSQLGDGPTLPLAVGRQPSRSQNRPTAAQPSASKAGTTFGVLVNAAALVVAFMLAFTIGPLLPASDAQATPSRVSPVSPAPSQPPTAAVQPKETPGASAVASPAEALQQEVDADSVEAETLVGSWVPQISSKKTGLVVDGVTFDDAQIWEDFQRSQSFHPDAILVRSSDYKSFRSPGYWVTLIADRYSTAAAANAWCDSQGYAASDCFAKRLSHVSGPAGNSVLRG
jgi:hypothetical protein